MAYREYQIKQIANINSQKEVKSAKNEGDEAKASNNSPNFSDSNTNPETKTETPAQSNTAKKPEETKVAPAASATSVNVSPKTPAATPAPAPVKRNIAPTPAAPAPSVPPVSNADYVENRILVLVNAERASKGLRPLSYNSTLAYGADIRVQEESILSFVGTDHTRPNGTAWSTVLSQIGYTGYSSAGENLAWGYKGAFPLTTTNLDSLANQLFTQWKNSPSHYSQIINPNYNQTGIGVTIIIQNGRLYYFGEELFGRR